MKTQLLYLDPYDDPASAREKLRWVQADRVVLVWPSHGRILRRSGDLVLLQREAARRAARLAILCHDPDVRQHAQRLGLPVFDDLPSVTQLTWPADSHRRPAFVRRRPLPQRPSALGRRPAAGSRSARSDTQRAFWMLFVIASMVGLVVVVGPAAIIELPVATSERSASFVVSFDPGVTSPSAVALPGRRLRVEVEGEVQLPTQGRVLVPSARATGIARFTNRSTESVVLPEGTGLRTVGTAPQRFETTERALVPAGVGAEVLVPIRAAAGGPQGNVAAGAIVAVEGTLGLQVSVTNPEPTAGGAVEMRPGVTPADAAAARLALERRLQQQANAELREQLREGEDLAPGSLRFVQELDSEIAPALGDASEIVQARLRVIAEGLAYDRVQLAAAAASALRGRVGETERILPDSIRVELTPRSDTDGAQYQAVARAMSLPIVDEASLAGALAGATVEEVTRQLSELEAARSPSLRLWPAWWPRLPLLSLRIRTIVVPVVP